MKVYLPLLITTLSIQPILAQASDPKVSIKKCASWYKKIEYYKELKRRSHHKESYEDAIDKYQNLMIKNNCPARDNEYFK